MNQVLPQVPIYHLEDVFLTGILAERVNIRPQDNVGFTLQSRAPDPCIFRQRLKTLLYMYKLQLVLV